MAIPQQQATRAFIQTLNTRFRDGIRLPAGNTLAASLQSPLQQQLFASGQGTAANNWTAKPEYVVLGDWTGGRLSQGRKFSAMAIMCQVRPIDATAADERVISDVQMAAKLLAMTWAPQLGIQQKLGVVQDWPGFDAFQNSTVVAPSVATTKAYFGFGVRDVTGIRRLVEPLIWVGQDNPSFVNVTNASGVGYGSTWTPSQDLEIVVELAGFYESVVANQ